MTLKHLKIFVAVCRYRSITIAGEKLSFSQPAVSVAIKELEEYCGEKLFDRISKKIYITDAGKRLLVHAEKIIATFDALDSEIKMRSNAGMLAIGTDGAAGSAVISRYIDRFRTGHPSAETQIRVDSAERLIMMLLGNSVDVAFVEGEIKLPHNLVSIKFMETEMVFVCGRGHHLFDKVLSSSELLIEDLSNEQFVLSAPGRPSRKIFDGFARANGLEIKPYLESEWLYALVSAVSKGVGIAFLPLVLVEDAVQMGIALHSFCVKGISIREPFYAVYHKDKFTPEYVENFISMLC